MVKVFPPPEQRCGIHLFQRRPAVLHLLHTFRRKPSNKSVELRVELLPAVESLLRIPRLVLEVEDYTIVNRLLVEICMYELAKTHLARVLERLIAVFLVVLQKRRPRKTNEHHLLPHDFAHGRMERAALRPVAFVNEHEDIRPLHGETMRIFATDDRLQLLNVLVEGNLHAVLVAVVGFRMHSEFVDKRAYQPRGSPVQHTEKIGLRPCLIQ